MPYAIVNFLAEKVCGGSGRNTSPGMGDIGWGRGGGDKFRFNQPESLPTPTLVFLLAPTKPIIWIGKPAPGYTVS